MGMFQLVIAVGVIMFTALIWVFLADTFNTVTTDMNSMIPTEMGGVAVNSTEISEKNNIINNTIYYSFAFIVIILLIWVGKSTLEQRNQMMYG